MRGKFKAIDDMSSRTNYTPSPSSETIKPDSPSTKKRPVFLPWQLQCSVSTWDERRATIMGSTTPKGNYKGKRRFEARRGTLIGAYIKMEAAEVCDKLIYILVFRV